jgi:hypothetical protein
MIHVSLTVQHHIQNEMAPVRRSICPKDIPPPPPARLPFAAHGMMDGMVTAAPHMYVRYSHSHHPQRALTGFLLPLAFI